MNRPTTSPAAPEPAAELARVRVALVALIHDADNRLDDDTLNRQLILERLLVDLDELAASIPNPHTVDGKEPRTP